MIPLEDKNIPFLGVPLIVGKFKGDVWHNSSTNQTYILTETKNGPAIWKNMPYADVPPITNDEWRLNMESCKKRLLEEMDRSRGILCKTKIAS